MLQTFTGEQIELSRPTEGKQQSFYLRLSQQYRKPFQYNIHNLPTLRLPLQILICLIFSFQQLTILIIILIKSYGYYLS